LRDGRQQRPLQVPPVAGTACKAAPARAIAGARIAAPRAHAAAGAPARATTIAEQTYTAGQVPARATATVKQIHTDALVRHHEQARRYTVRPGDTLSSIAQRFYGNPADWHCLYQVNRSVLHNPNVIRPGEVLTVPYEPPASGRTSTPAGPAGLTTSAALSRPRGCPGLEKLWAQAGGSAPPAVTAASIAMAESSGRQYPTGAAGAP